MFATQGPQVSVMRLSTGRYKRPEAISLMESVEKSSRRFASVIRRSSTTTDVWFRITSYNVCYTKLLRLVVESADKRIGHVANPFFVV